ncbi:zinc ABC transporter substrate-binding protein [Saccharomonospora sp. CUA-673]|nr:zinc ABC transporter substrate-binding protein [Saccharomonospora sp. CUA-673]
MSAPRSHRRWRTACALFAVAPLVLTACGTGVTNDPATEEAGDTVTITNCGRDLSFEAEPERIVGMMPSQTELLLRLGAGDALAGQAQTDTSPLPDDIAQQAADVPVLSTDAPPAREDLLAAEPDLVVSPTTYEFTAEQGFASIDQLAQNGAEAYVATGGCAERRNNAEVDDVFTDIANLGEILRVPDAAADLERQARDRLEAVEAGIADRPRLSVAQVYVEGNTLGAIGAGVEADIIEKAGGENVFDPDAPEFADFFAAEVNPEEIISRNPDAIVFGTTGPGQEEQTRNYLRNTFPDVPAVQEDRLIAVPQSDLYPGTLGNIDAVETIANRLYPGSVE